LKFKYILISILLLGLIPKSSLAKYVRHWSEKEGLSNREVHDYLQDSYGFVWLATANGLNRFDGYEFWCPNKDPQSHLASSNITCLFEKDKVLWVGTDNGITLLDLETYKTKEIKQNYGTALNLYDNYITGIYGTFDGTILVTTSKGFLHRYEGNNKFTPFYNKMDSKGSFGVRLHFTEDSYFYWIKSENKGTFKLNKKTLEVLQQYHRNAESHIGSIKYIKGYGTIAFCKEGIEVYNPKTNRFEKGINTAIKDVYNIIQDYEKNLWIVANDSKHLLKFNKTLTDVTEALFPVSENVNIRQIVESKSHMLWICTNNGLYQYSIEKASFASILKQQEVLDKNFVPSFRGMLEDADGTIYAAGYGGLFSIDTNNHVKRLLDNKIPYSPYILINAKDNYLWAITEGFGLIKVNKKTGHIIKIFSSRQIAERHNFQYLLSGILDNDSIFWLGGYEGVFTFHLKTKKVSVTTLQFNGISFNRLKVKQFYRTKDNRLWISSSKGLFILDKHRKPVKCYNELSSKTIQLPSSNINGILEGSRGIIWIFTSDAGLCALNEKEQTIEIFNKKNGLADDNVAAVLEDNRGNIWVSTNNGLSELNPISKKISNFYSEDGLSNNEFNTSSAIKTSNNRYFFGGINGINFFNPDIGFTNHSFKQLLLFSYLEVLDKEGEIRKIYNQEEIRKGIILPSKNAYLNLSFCATEFLRAEKNTFQYKLEGFSDKWVPLGEQHSLRFATLPAGTYVLHIKGIGSRGVYIVNELLFPITVNPVFYNTKWFVALLILFVALIVYFFQYNRIQKLHEIASIRTKLSSDLHDHVGSVLTRVSMQAELIEENASKEDQGVLKSIILSCREALTNMRDVIWSVDARNLTSGNLFDKITELTQYMFESTSFHYEMRLDKSLYNIPLTQLEKQELYFIVKEALHNVLKHAAEKSVIISAQREQHNFYISIYNAGIVNSEKIVTGIGTTNILMRAKRIAVTVNIQKENGYTVKVIYPLKIKDRIRWK
jgi:ligand-binding sensor domain-containing protein/signal transduction histidine kinase